MPKRLCYNHAKANNNARYPLGSSRRVYINMRKSNNYFRRQRIGLAVVGGIMTLMVAFSLTPTFAGVVATITNSVNTASTGTLVMEEKNHDGTVTCTTTGTGSATCATINKYGGALKDAIGIPEEQLRKAAKSAVCKINIDSDNRLAMTAAIRKVFAEKPAEFDPRKYLGPARDAAKALYIHKIKNVLGSDNKL